MGDTSHLALKIDSLQGRDTLRIYLLTDPWIDGGCSHKLTARGILDDLDSEYDYDWSMPVSVLYQSGKLEDVETSAFWKELPIQP
jgi:hypothetical protein